MLIGLFSCRSTKKINTVIAPRDTVAGMAKNNSDDSVKLIRTTIEGFQKTFIDFKTFSSKIKVDVEDNKGKHPDLSAVVRIIKDSAIWISLSATFLNIEVYRILIKKDQIILLNKQDKEVQYRTLDYLQEVTQIPFDYKTVEDLLIGNPVFFTDNIISFRKNDDKILILTAGEFFKHLLTITSDKKILLHSKLDDVDRLRNRTADISYGEFENVGNINFPTSRHILISEKSKMDIRLRFRQIEFNKQLSVNFPVPKNYTTK